MSIYSTNHPVWSQKLNTNPAHFGFSDLAPISTLVKKDTNGPLMNLMDYSTTKMPSTTQYRDTYDSHHEFFVFHYATSIPDVQGLTDNSVFGTNVADCIDHCSHRPKCVGMVVLDSGRKCFLKTKEQLAAAGLQKTVGTNVWMKKQYDTEVKEISVPKEEVAFEYLDPTISNQIFAQIEGEVTPSSPPPPSAPSPTSLEGC